MNTPDLPFSPASERNKQAILAQLLRLLPQSGRALEIAAGTGQHAAWFASALPGWTWQPTDLSAQALPGITQRTRLAGCQNVSTPLVLDVLDPVWPSRDAAFTDPFDLVFCANMVHIAPLACCEALMRGCNRHLSASGYLVLYGPFFEDGIEPAAGNRAFDQSLRSRDPAWGVRRLHDVDALAQQCGLRLVARHGMPANNLLLTWGRADH